MRFRSRLEKLPGPSAVAIGNFDGFHAGHRKIIETLQKTAEREKLLAVALTFHPHPRLYFNQPIQLISTDRQRLDDWIHRAGRAMSQNFSLQRAHLTGLEQRLHSVNPRQVLQRGYAILKFSDGKPVFSVRQVQSGDALVASLMDGEVDLTVDIIHPTPP